MNTGRWLIEGLRASLFKTPRIGDVAPGRLQLLLLVALVMAVELALARFAIDGPARFDLRGWLAPYWTTGALLLLAWCVLPEQDGEHPGRPAGLAAWFLLLTLAVLPSGVVSQLIAAAQAHDAMPFRLGRMPAAAWSVDVILLAWVVGVAVRLAWSFGVKPAALAAFGTALVAVSVLSAWQFPDRPWQEDESQASPQRPGLRLTQEVFEGQQEIWRKAVAALAPQRAGITDVYGLVFAPYAREEVFLRESRMVARLLEERFDARGRVLLLANNAATTASLPWATPLNLERAIAALAARMDREHDLLVVYLTSHGASDFQLAASHWPLEVNAVSPRELRTALDKAGVRHRLIAISACYSGGWVAPLAGEDTLVMTAADATHTSYGCGSRSELTFFGRAIFDEQLRTTHSFEKAFAAAVPLIRQREVDAGKSDGFSNPQISVGAKIRPLLDALEQRLESAH